MSIDDVLIGAARQTRLLAHAPFSGFKVGAALLCHDGRIIGGWEIGGIAVMQSGLPFTVTVAGSPSNTGAGSRANPITGANPYPSSKSINQWFDPAAFTTPPAFTWGTLGRNSLNEPANDKMNSSAIGPAAALHVVNFPAVVRLHVQLPRANRVVGILIPGKEEGPLGGAHGLFRPWAQAP
jgi:hypothetical protein